MRIRQTAVNTEQRGVNLKPTEDIEKRIKNVNIVIDSESNKRVFSNISQAFEKSTAKESTPTGLNIHRIIFKSPISKLAAAVIIVAISFFVIHQGPDEHQRGKDDRGAAGGQQGLPRHGDPDGQRGGSNGRSRYDAQ